MEEQRKGGKDCQEMRKERREGLAQIKKGTKKARKKK